MAEVPPAAAVMLITGFVACFTEFASNTATIIIFLPVIAELVRLDINLKLYDVFSCVLLLMKWINVHHKASNGTQIDLKSSELKHETSCFNCSIFWLKGQFNADYLIYLCVLNIANP